MVVVTKKLIFSVGEVWFDEEPEKIHHNVDVILYRYRTQPIKGVPSDEFHTMLIDLTKSQNELWENISKNDRYKINRAAQRDEIVYETWDKIDSSTLNEFSDFYDNFAEQKGLSKINRSQLKRRADAGVIDISHVKSKDGISLVWHVHYRNHNRACLLYSASIKNTTDTSYQSMLGRANRYHHWEDMLRFKKSGISIYDFGGWYEGDTDQEKLRINDFKNKFGGQIVKNFNCNYCINIKGNLYLYLLKTYSSLMQLPLGSKLKHSLINQINWLTKQNA